MSLPCPLGRWEASFCCIGTLNTQRRPLPALGLQMVSLGSPTVLPLMVDPHWALSRVVSRHTDLQWWHTREVLVICDTKTAHMTWPKAWQTLTQPCPAQPAPERALCSPQGSTEACCRPRGSKDSQALKPGSTCADRILPAVSPGPLATTATFVT